MSKPEIKGSIEIEGERHTIEYAPGVINLKQKHYFLESLASVTLCRYMRIKSMM